MNSKNKVIVENNSFIASPKLGDESEYATSMASRSASSSGCEVQVCVCPHLCECIR